MTASEREPYSTSCKCGGVWILITPPTYKSAFYSCSNWPTCKKQESSCSCGGPIQESSPGKAHCRTCMREWKVTPRNRELDSHGLGFHPKLDRCPLSDGCRCGGKWRTRIAVVGRIPFYGCSNFPQCKLQDINCQCGGILRETIQGGRRLWRCDRYGQRCQQPTISVPRRVWVSPLNWSAENRESLFKFCWCEGGGDYKKSTPVLFLTDSYLLSTYQSRMINREGSIRRSSLSISAISFQHGRGKAHYTTKKMDELCWLLVERTKKQLARDYPWNEFSAGLSFGQAREQYIGNQQRWESAQFHEEQKLENLADDLRETRSFIRDAIGPEDDWNAREHAWALDQGWDGWSSDSAPTSRTNFEETQEPRYWLRCAGSGCGEVALDTAQIQFREYSAHLCSKGHADYLCPCGGEFIWKDVTWMKEGHVVNRQFVGCTAYPTCKETRPNPKFFYDHASYPQRAWSPWDDLERLAQIVFQLKTYGISHS